MTDDTQPEAMDLADWLEAVGGGGISPNRCAALLREQHTRIAELESELEAVGAGGVSGPLMGIAAPPTAQAEGWISVEDARKPQPGKPVVFWVWAERYQEDDEGRQIAQDASGLHLGEWRESENGNYFDNYSTPFADREAVLWWMDPTPPTSAEEVECISHPHENSAPQPAPAPLSDDAKDAARWRMVALIGNEVMLHPEKRTQAAAVKAYMDATHSGLDLTGAVDAAIAAQGGK